MKNCTVYSKIAKDLYPLKSLVDNLSDVNTDPAEKALSSVKKKCKSIWISRSVAVATFTFGYDENGNLYVLASQRGKGTPDKELIGAWNCQCGYLDYDEDTYTAAIRETFEETGVDLSNSDVKFWKFIDDPHKDERQNIVFRYISVFKDFCIDNITFSTDNMEKDEVSDIKWIDIDSISDYKWAFNHKEIIEEAVNQYKLRKNKIQKIIWRISKWLDKCQ